jgi:peptidoglycan/LPS O-acetylase OafA/YrhL
MGYRQLVRYPQAQATMDFQGVSHRYLPALDGLRAVAVASVFAFHLGLAHFGGGFLGVDVFFVLSGFLITSLLVEERASAGRIRLPAFWGRRARRLLPAVFAVLAVVSAYAWAGGPGVDVQTLRPDAISTLFYFANWHFWFSQQPYFSQFVALSPLMHTWSLAIEEQFYLLWPLILVGLLHVRRRGRHSGRSAPSAKGRALAVTLVLAAASAAWMAALYHGPATQDRAYYGTDARAFELLVGAALALALWGTRGVSGRALGALRAGAWAGAGGLAYLIATLSGREAWMYRGGFVLAALASALIIASSVHGSGGPIGKVLSLRPVRWVGKVSYGIYLWHWVVIDLVTEGNLGVGGWRLKVVQVAITLAVATLSFYLLEQPIRRLRLPDWRRFALAPAGAAATLAVVLAGTVPVAQASSAPPPALAASRQAPFPGAEPVSASPLGLAPAADSSPPPGISLPPGRHPSASDPLRVMFVGDSVMQDAEPGIAAALQATGAVKVVAQTAFGGFGLSRSGAWRADWPAEVARYRPELVMGTWSWDDEVAQADPAGYAALLDQALQTLLSPGDGVDAVVLLQFPKTGSNPADSDTAQRVAAAEAEEARRQVWNAVAAGSEELWPGQVAYLPVASSVEVNGHYTAWLPQAGGRWVRARKIDNAHICPAGAVALGQAVVSQLSPLVGLPPAAPGWWAGSWTQDPRYNDPPGACPDDQPPAGYAAELAPGAPPTTQFQ